MAKLTHILDAIRSKDYTVATESLAQLMQQKIEERLAQERVKVASTLVAEAVEEKEKLLCHDCGNVWMGNFPAKCPECGCRKCVTTDEPLTEDWDSPRKHTCRKCFGYWMGPGDDNECPHCGASESRPIHEAVHAKEVYVDLVRRLSDPEYDPQYNGSPDDPDIDEVIALAKQEHGAKFAQDLDNGARKMHFPRHDGLSSFTPDTYWGRIAPRINKTGFANKQDVNALKKKIQQTRSSGAYAKRNLPEASEGHNSGQGWPSKAEAERWAEKVRKYDDREITVVKDGKWWRIHYGPEVD